MCVVDICVSENIKFVMEGSNYADYITSCMKEFGNWEPNLTDKFLSILLHANKYMVEGVVVDVGACFGYYSLLAAQSNYKAYAFEPNPVTIGILEKNIKRSGKQIVNVKNIALGDSADSKYIKFTAENIGGACINDEMNGPSKVSVDTLDNQHIKEHVIIYKIDAEGYENKILKGSLQTMEKNGVDFVFLEVSPKFSSIEKIISEIFIPLWNHNYLAFDIGLQDSGYMKEAIKRFRLFRQPADITSYLQNTGQTNFLFIRRDKSDSLYLTGSIWKDELISKWLIESNSEIERVGIDLIKKSNKIAMEIDEIKNENRKLFSQLKDAATYQQELLNIINKQNEILSST